MKVVLSAKYKRKLKSKKIQTPHSDRITRILNLLYTFENFNDLENSSFAKTLYKFERLKHSQKSLFSFGLDNKEMRLIVKPNTVTDYSNLDLEKEVLICDISFDHYKDIVL